MNGFVRFANTALSADRDEQTRLTRIDRLVSKRSSTNPISSLDRASRDEDVLSSIFHFFSSTPADPVPFRHADGAVGQCAHVTE